MFYFSSLFTFFLLGFCPNNFYINRGIKSFVLMCILAVYDVPFWQRNLKTYFSGSFHFGRFAPPLPWGGGGKLEKTPEFTPWNIKCFFTPWNIKCFFTLACPPRGGGGGPRKNTMLPTHFFRIQKNMAFRILPDDNAGSIMTKTKNVWKWTYIITILL